MLFLILLQPAAQAPDIELQANVRARSVTIEKQGQASLTVTSEPEGRNLVDVRAPRANGRKSLRNVNVSVRAEARIGERANNPEAAETSPPE